MFQLRAIGNFGMEVDGSIDRVHVVGAHSVTSHLALNSNFSLNCQQKFYVWAREERKL
jgi:hypothetical protein